MIYGYVRVSTNHQDTELQVLHLSQLAVSEFMKNMPVAEQLIALC